MRTDRHADQLRARADQLHQQARHTPEPVADRLLTNAARLRSWADEHDRTRLTEPETPPR
ncbi:hypothetical protein SAMN05216371_8116 [Streptomyces sp. TLI_053]|uniref:hypothetical protein n=1 Tax=Streptomyces sp. TLI_053 TaxID=1855352 RepID=UPI0008799633|nr:hypothetical protein [Streptomyces sp. TLI_053]SDT83296.1 hypothetical protein SAMN05216371_8116 [Streptomyces sp. TLI_053]